MTTRSLSPDRTRTVALLALLGVTAAWGATFFMLAGVVTRVPVADFLAVRFLLAAAVLTVALTVARPGAVGRLSPAERRQAVALGVVYGAAQLLQTAGLTSTSASVSGFVTGSYVVLTPVLAVVLLRRRVGPGVWVSTALAAVGLGVLALHGVALGTGEAITLLGALCYALHVVGLGAWSRPRNVLGMTVVQLWVVAVICGVGAVPGGITLPAEAADWAVLVFMALVAGALALLLQTWAQAHVTPERAAVVMTMEPVWAAGFAVTLGGESLGVRGLVGGALVLAAMYLAERAPVPPTDATDEPGQRPVKRGSRCANTADIASPRSSEARKAEFQAAT